MDPITNALFQVCVNHRERNRIHQIPRTNDCTTKACKTGCPIKKMPKAITRQALKQIEADVLREEREKKKAERLKNLEGGDN